MTKVVGIVGFKGSGKDALGDRLVEQGFVRDSFANPLKDTVAATFGWSREMMEGDTAESRKWREEPDEWWEEKLNWSTHPGSRVSPRFTPRIAMQWFGTEVFRTAFHNNVWIYSLESRLRQHEKVVITDCRFPNEIGVVNANHGLVIRVKRGPDPEWVQTAKLAVMGDRDAQAAMDQIGVHSSEWAWINEPVDAVIENDGTLEELWSKLDCLVQNHF